MLRLGHQENLLVNFAKRMVMLSLLFIYPSLCAPGQNALQDRESVSLNDSIPR